MPNRRAVITTGVAAVLVGCGPTIGSYTGPEVTRIVVQKAQRRMYLMGAGSVLRTYEIDLGFAPVGHKEIEGDGKTPEGSYYIDRRNPRSAYHLSIGISYPNAQDVAKAKALGESPGGDIFIHGAAKPSARGRKDWTWGCISVSNKDVEEIYSMVRLGTQIDLNA
ncbi:MAG: L,D-transpeptidase family protein [Marinosulfonomonas sp.]|nr:L,D-transpeptidase family protein [Marinosulfonomonas sp.]